MLVSTFAVQSRWCGKGVLVPYALYIGPIFDDEYSTVIVSPLGV